MSPLCTVALVGITAREVGMLVSHGSLGRTMGGCWLPHCPHRLLSYGSQGGVPEGCDLGTPPMSFALAQEGFLWGCALINFRNKAEDIQDGEALMLSGSVTAQVYKDPREATVSTA